MRDCGSNSLGSHDSSNSVSLSRTCRTKEIIRLAGTEVYGMKARRPSSVLDQLLDAEAA